MPKDNTKKRKRQFYGNRFTKSSEKNCQDNVTFEASSSKLNDVDFSNLKENDMLCGNRIFDVEILSEIFLALCCPNCFENKLQLEEDSIYGLCSHFNLKCKGCSFVKRFATSKKSVNLPDINSRFVYGMRQIGKGFSAAQKLCGTLNMPGLTKTPYAEHETRLLKVVSEVAENCMRKAAAEVIQKKKDNSGQVPECGVSVDGTWQRRGHTSMNGCVAVVSVDTGKVIDIEIMSSFCRICKKLQKMPKNTEYYSLRADHICQCNFSGSASKMETVGASRIFNRSIDMRELQYTEYYGDGDSKAFLNVKDTYGENSVLKLECVGHVQKRVGSRLRKLKSKVKGLSGKGKLTDTFIDRLQNYYGIALRSNVGNLQKMQQNVIAVLFHCASNIKKTMHGQCPAGKDSWCYYQRAISMGTPIIKEKCSGLPNDVLNAVKPVYLELCSKELLTKCLHGLTQNVNECFNGIIWQRVPKEVFVCLRLLKLGAYDAAIQFNDGYQGCLEVFQKLGIDPGYFTMKAYKQFDSERIRYCKRLSTQNAKKRRKVLKAHRKKKITDSERKEGELYKSGAF